jgi:hypothetical protein
MRLEIYTTNLHRSSSSCRLPTVYFLIVFALRFAHIESNLLRLSPSIYYAIANEHTFNTHHLITRSTKRGLIEVEGISRASLVPVLNKRLRAPN